MCYVVVLYWVAVRMGQYGVGMFQNPQPQPQPQPNLSSCNINLMCMSNTRAFVIYQFNQSCTSGTWFIACFCICLFWFGKAYNVKCSTKNSVKSYLNKVKPNLDSCICYNHKGLNEQVHLKNWVKSSHRFIQFREVNY